MEDKWMIRGPVYGNCICDYSCPCQFQAPTTHGRCEGLGGGIIEEGYFNDVRLDGLRWVMILSFPGEVADGNGKWQHFIDESASPEQREALGKIVRGESGAPGSSVFNVFGSLMVDVKETLYVPIDVEVDIEARHGKIHIDGLVESKGEPIPNPFTGGIHGVSITIDEGMEYETANVGRGSSKVTAGLEMEVDDGYGQFCVYHIDQDGLVRSKKAA